MSKRKYIVLGMSLWGLSWGSAYVSQATESAARAGEYVGRLGGAVLGSISTGLVGVGVGGPTRFVGGIAKGGVEAVVGQERTRRVLDAGAATRDEFFLKTPFLGRLVGNKTARLQRTAQLLQRSVRDSTKRGEDAAIRNSLRLWRSLQSTYEGFISTESMVAMFGQAGMERGDLELLIQKGVQNTKPESSEHKFLQSMAKMLQINTQENRDLMRKVGQVQNLGENAFDAIPAGNVVPPQLVQAIQQAPSNSDQQKAEALKGLKREILEVKNSNTAESAVINQVLNSLTNLIREGMYARKIADLPTHFAKATKPLPYDFEKNAKDKFGKYTDTVLLNIRIAAAYNDYDLSTAQRDDWARFENTDTNTWLKPETAIKRLGNIKDKVRSV